MDSLVHLVQFLLEEDEDRVVLSIDGIGAFDHVCRARFFEELRSEPSLQELLPFVSQWYSGMTNYVWLDAAGQTHTVTQGDGGEQDDALMPALFCLALKRALQDIQRLLPAGCIVLAYLDDIYVIYPHAYTRECYDIVQAVLGARCHINVNLGKLKAWSRGRSDPPPNVEQLGGSVWRGSNLPVNERGLKVLGTPVGTAEFVAEVDEEAIQEEAKLQ